MTASVKAAKQTAAPKPKASARTAVAVKAVAKRARPAADPASDKPVKRASRPAAKPAAPQADAPAAKPAARTAVKPAAKAGTKAAPKVKLNKRSSETIAKILAVTEEIILRSGAERISILDVCDEVGISRGTFYRYFSSQDDLLDAFSRHKRDQFHATLQKTAASEDPDERFQALIEFIDDYLENSRARRLLLVAPDYATRWLQRIFADSVHRFQDILGIVFDAWEERHGIVIDRELVCELMVRYIMSDVLVPAGPDRRNLMRRIERFVLMLLSGRVARR
ncbi:TetR/AcrR family transcriptional regulator [Massilia sp. TW-1]|uniref:TetR/AcrR family transcriptional regulator n=1 Tax=Telluria antibiotica TaxID=2717319 RepID=A0ABX0P5K3_9BURK|nr:TetR/AcrR family transcriptional regulator [Telluria antibiotica]NIA52508.1 TetR/AcrR family transcriptional regulator [Telluria antibiotica]